jgi:hypothetical protein
MNNHDDKSVRIQILAAKAETGAAGRAVALVRDRMREFADIAREQGAEALLVCPATDDVVTEGCDLVVAARFGLELDEDTIFWRQRSLEREIYRALRIDVLVLDFDASLNGFLRDIEPKLAAPYRDEIGRRAAECF